MEYPIVTHEPYLSFRSRVRNYIQDHVAANAPEWERLKKFPAHLLRDLGNKRFLGLSLPKNVGGQGKDFWHEVVFAEELAKCGALGWALSVLVQTNMIAPILSELGGKKQKAKILKPALEGKYYLALAATDRESGSDLASIQTEATLDKTGYYRIHGEKRYISNGSIAQYIVTLVRVLSTKDIWSLGLIIVPHNIKGLTRKRLETAGLKTSDTASLVFNGCKIPKENLLGLPGKGFYYLLKGLQRERLICAVALNSLSLDILRKTVKFLKERERFGEPLSKKQAIRHRIVELSTSTESSRQFAYAVCDAFAKNRPVDEEIIMLKNLSYETCQKVIRECAHLHGAEAFLADHWLSHVYQDSQAFTLAAGSSEIMKDLLAGMMGM